MFNKLKVNYKMINKETLFYLQCQRLYVLFFAVNTIVICSQKSWSRKNIYKMLFKGKIVCALETEGACFFNMLSLMFFYNEMDYIFYYQWNILTTSKETYSIHKFLFSTILIAGKEEEDGQGRRRILCNLNRPNYSHILIDLESSY